MNFKIFNFLNHNFPNFNPENEQDIIRAEKLLKAESITSEKFSISEISEIIQFLRESRNYFSEIIKNNRLITILAEKKPLFLFLPLKLHLVNPEKLSNFSKYSDDALHETLQIAIQNNQWSFINYLKDELYDLFSPNAKEFLI